MFESIDELEKEVQDFRQNILASKQLINSINQLTTTTKKQQERLATAAEALMKKLDATPAAIKTDNSVLLDELKSCIADFRKGNQELVSHLSTESEEHIKDSTASISAAYQEYTARAESVETALKNSEIELASKYSAFIETLESTNADLQKGNEDLVSHLSAENKRLLEESITSISATCHEHIARLESVEAALKKSEIELASKYDAFIEKLESTNVDQLFKMCQDIKKSVQKKFTFLMSGICIMLIIIILSIFVK